MSTKSNLGGLPSSRITPEEIVEKALETVRNGTNKYKSRWIVAIKKAGIVFTSNDPITIGAMHDRLLQYDTTQNQCNCTAAATNSPCYHRAYVLLRSRFAESNA